MGLEQGINFQHSLAFEYYCFGFCLPLLVEMLNFIHDKYYQADRSYILYVAFKTKGVLVF